MIALPFLECMIPYSNALAQAAKSPLRLITLYKPNGELEGSWNISNNVLPYVLEPLAPMRSEITFIKGLANRVSEAYRDGHAPRLSCFLTSSPINASTSVVSGSQSIDQMIAQARGVNVLNIGGPFDQTTLNGFNAEYFNNLSWVGPRAAPKIKSPRTVFNSIFGSAGPAVPVTEENLRKLRKKSLLDHTMAETSRLVSSVGANDRQKLDEYLTSIREIERAIGVQETNVQQCIADTGQPADNNTFEVHTKLMLDLIVKGMQCGKTQIATYLMDVEVGYGYKDHHHVSHHSENSAYPQRYRDVNRWYATQLNYLLTKLQAVKETDGTLLSNTFLIYGSGISDGDAHSARNLPILLAGRAQGLLTPGRVLDKNGQPLANLMLTTLKKFGIARTSIGDSTMSWNDV